jgi:hypothetical protein
LWHFHCDASNSNCAWQYINDPAKTPNPNTIAHVIYGVTDSFSDFALLLPASTQPPAVACVGTASKPMVLAANGSCLASVDNVNGVAGTCSGGGGGLASCTFDGAPSRSLGLGPQSIVVQGTAGDGSSAQCTSYITVTDQTPPSISVGASPSVLSPANGKLKPIQLTKAASDACDAQPVVSCSVTSNEPVRRRDRDDGKDKDGKDKDDREDKDGKNKDKDDDDKDIDRDKDDDIVWKNGQLFLRAERNGNKTDRIYTIACTATDASGNSVTGSTTVTVPRDRDRDER